MHIDWLSNPCIKHDNFPDRTRIRLGGMVLTYLNTIRRPPTDEAGNIHEFMDMKDRKKYDIYDADFAEKIFRQAGWNWASGMVYKIRFICTGKPHPVESDQVLIDAWFKKYYRNYHDDDVEDAS